MRKVLVKIFVTVFGYLLLILGIIGCFLPVLQGILMIIAGLTLLSTEYHWPSRIINRFKNKFDEARAENARKKREKQLKKSLKKPGNAGVDKEEERIEKKD